MDWSEDIVMDFSESSANRAAPVKNDIETEIHREQKRTLRLALSYISFLNRTIRLARAVHKRTSKGLYEDVWGVRLNIFAAVGNRRRDSFDAQMWKLHNVTGAAQGEGKPAGTTTTLNILAACLVRIDDFADEANDIYHDISANVTVINDEDRATAKLYEFTANLMVNTTDTAPVDAYGHDDSGYEADDNE